MAKSIDSIAIPFCFLLGKLKFVGSNFFLNITHFYEVVGYDEGKNTFMAPKMTVLDQDQKK